MNILGTGTSSSEAWASCEDPAGCPRAVGWERGGKGPVRWCAAHSPAGAREARFAQCASLWTRKSIPGEPDEKTLKVNRRMGEGGGSTSPLGSGLHSLGALGSPMSKFLLAVKLHSVSLKRTP